MFETRQFLAKSPALLSELVDSKIEVFVAESLTHKIPLIQQPLISYQSNSITFSKTNKMFEPEPPGECAQCPDPGSGGAPTRRDSSAPATLSQFARSKLCNNFCELKKRKINEMKSFLSIFVFLHFLANCLIIRIKQINVNAMGTQRNTPHNSANNLKYFFFKKVFFHTPQTALTLSKLLSPRIFARK